MVDARIVLLDREVELCGVQLPERGKHPEGGVVDADLGADQGGLLAEEPIAGPEHVERGAAPEPLLLDRRLELEARRGEGQAARLQRRPRGVEACVGVDHALLDPVACLAQPYPRLLDAHDGKALARGDAAARVVVDRHGELQAQRREPAERVADLRVVDVGSRGLHSGSCGHLQARKKAGLDVLQVHFGAGQPVGGRHDVGVGLERDLDRQIDVFGKFRQFRRQLELAGPVADQGLVAALRAVESGARGDQAAARARDGGFQRDHVGAGGGAELEAPLRRALLLEQRLEVGFGRFELPARLQDAEIGAHHPLQKSALGLQVSLAGLPQIHFGLLSGPSGLPEVPQGHAQVDSGAVADAFGFAVVLDVDAIVPVRPVVVGSVFAVERGVPVQAGAVLSPRRHVGFVGLSLSQPGESHVVAAPERADHGLGQRLRGGGRGCRHRHRQRRGRCGERLSCVQLLHL